MKQLRIITFTIFVVGLLASSAEKPELVVVISLDQFRYDYLSRFERYFGKRGFNLFLKQGASFVNCTYLHSANMTGPGHAVILSGTYGNVNGIIANEWYDAASGKTMYCVEDESSPAVGTGHGEPRSPKNFIGTAVGDQLRESNGGLSKVISMSNKDRAAILMGGRTANAAYWMVDSAFVTSTYYMQDLPGWVKKFNASGKINSYFGKVWDRLLPEKEYQGADDFPFESDAMGRTFPHIINGGKQKISGNYYWALIGSPFGSEILAEFARQAIENEKLGRRGVTDLLCIGFSSNDYVGHAFGPNSHEVMDMTVRTDRILESLFVFIDQKIGLDSCAILLTSDHGVAAIPEYILSINGNADVGRVSTGDFRTAAEAALTGKYGSLTTAKEWFLRKSGANLYLNPAALKEKNLAPSTAEEVARDTIQHMRGVAAVYTKTQLMNGEVGGSLGKKALFSFHPLRSGNIFYQLKPGYLDGYSRTGTSHSEPWDYDAHVPMLWYGMGIRPGTYYSSAHVSDIAPTLSAILGIEFPAGVQGRVLKEIITNYE